MPERLQIDYLHFVYKSIIIVTKVFLFWGSIDSLYSIEPDPNRHYYLKVSRTRADMEKNIDFGIVSDIYDDYVKVDFDIPFYKSLCKEYSGNVLELMCGTGRISVPLIKEEVKLTCVDYSQEMLDVFSRKIPGIDIQLINQDISKLDIGKQFEFIFIPFNSISEITDKNKRKQAVKRAFEHLMDNGDFLVTLYNPAFRLKSADGNMKYLGKFEISDNRTLIVTCCNTFNQSSSVIYGTQFYEIYDSRNIFISKRFLDISFSVISREEMIQMCTESGFKLKKLYGDYDFGEFKEDSMYMNFLFTKKIH